MTNNTPFYVLMSMIFVRIKVRCITVVSYQLKTLVKILLTFCKYFIKLHNISGLLLDIFDQRDERVS